MATEIEVNDQKLLEIVAKSYKDSQSKIDTLRMFAENK